MRLKEECNRLTATLKEERASFASRIASLETTVANLETSGAEKDAVILELTAVSSQKDSQIAELKAALRRSASRPDAEVGAWLLLNNFLLLAQFSDQIVVR